MAHYTHSPTEGTVSGSSRLEDGLRKLDCFSRFDAVAYWMSRTRDLIANAETYSYPAFRESFLEYDVRLGNPRWNW